MLNLKPLAMLVMGAASVMANAAEPITVQGGQIHFEGSVVNSPCVIENDSANQTVRLGQFQSNQFAAKGDTSSPVDFDIKLMNCDASTMSNAFITFKGQTLAGEADKLAPAATQAADIVADGVGIQILQDSKVLNVKGDTGSNPVQLIDGSNRLLFQARYISTNAIVAPGSANATADFTITYQ